VGSADGTDPIHELFGVTDYHWLEGLGKIQQHATRQAPNLNNAYQQLNSIQQGVPSLAMYTSINYYVRTHTCECRVAPPTGKQPTHWHVAPPFSILIAYLLHGAEHDGLIGTTAEQLEVVSGYKRELTSQS